jgi:single-strand DNA-binding protein
MSADISVAVITGRLGRDAEMSYISSGTALAKFSLAVNRSRKNASGEWTEEVSWFDFEMWGKRAEGLYQYLTKGLKVTCQCEIRQDRWEDKNGGGKRSKVKFVVNNLVFAGGKTDGQTNSRPQQSGGYDPAAEFNESVDDGKFEDDVPF